MQIHKRSKSEVGRRAWNILRLALLWARKGGVFVVNKRLHLHLSHYLKSLRQSSKGNGALQYGDRQISFDATPIIHVRMHRPNSNRFRLPHIPCINPHSQHSIFDFDDEDDQSSPRQSFLLRNGDEEDEEEYIYDDEEIQEEEEEGIDLKAEEFIANFYQQLKLQRQFNTRRRSD